MARIVWLGAIAAILLANEAHAQAQSSADIATAQALFDEGKRLMQDRRYDEACPKLVESQRLDPGGGTLLAIALCHEAQGRTATAWGDFNLAASEARKDHRADRESAATEHIHKLELKMPRARIVVTTPVDGLEVRRGEEVVGSVQWGTALPIDPGTYVFEASAPGRTTWRTTVTIPSQGSTTDVTIPTLEVAPATPPPAPVAPPVATVTPTAPPAPAPAATPLPPPSDHPSSTLATAGWITGGVSVVALGVGAVFGLSAKSSWSTAQQSCHGTVCTDPNAPSEATSAGNKADVSTVLVTVGAVGIAASVAMLLLAPSSHASTALRVSPMVGGVNGLALSGNL